MGGEDQGRGIGFSIVRLQIATHHTVPVRFVERISHLRSVFQHLIGCDDFVRNPSVCRQRETWPPQWTPIIPALQKHAE
jgi:hypothetical protein